jgi:uncharacterized OB-fold protein
MTQNNSNSARPRPLATTYSRFFWEGARRGELLIQRCLACTRYMHPPGPICCHCGSEQITPVPVSGRGKVHSYTRVHHLFHPAFKDQLPYLVARIELDEQANLFLITNLRNCPHSAARVGLAVRVLFETIGEDVLPQFEPAAAREAV